MPDEAKTPGPEAGTAPRPLPPLPQYTCGACHQEFGSNCDPDDIMCAWCEAQRCPHCHAWFGGEEGVVSPDPGQVSVSREDLRWAMGLETLTAATADRMRDAQARIMAAAGDPR